MMSASLSEEEESRAHIKEDRVRGKETQRAMGDGRTAKPRKESPDKEKKEKSTRPVKYPTGPVESLVSPGPRRLTTKSGIKKGRGDSALTPSLQIARVLN